MPGTWTPGHVDYSCECGKATSFNYGPPGLAISPTWTCGGCGRFVRVLDEVECEPTEFGEFLRSHRRDLSPLDL